MRGLSALGVLGIAAFVVNLAGGYKISSILAAIKHVLRVIT